MDCSAAQGERGRWAVHGWHSQATRPPPSNCLAPHCDPVQGHGWHSQVTNPRPSSCHVQGHDWHSQVTNPQPSSCLAHHDRAHSVRAHCGLAHCARGAPAHCASSDCSAPHGFLDHHTSGLGRHHSQAANRRRPHCARGHCADRLLPHVGRYSKHAQRGDAPGLARGPTHVRGAHVRHARALPFPEAAVHRV